VNRKLFYQIGPVVVCLRSFHCRHHLHNQLARAVRRSLRQVAAVHQLQQFQDFNLNLGRVHRLWHDLEDLLLFHQKLHRLQQRQGQSGFHGGRRLRLRSVLVAVRRSVLVEVLHFLSKPVFLLLIRVRCRHRPTFPSSIQLPLAFHPKLHRHRQLQFFLVFDCRSL
jgi:hypothetical protein